MQYSTLPLTLILLAAKSQAYPSKPNEPVYVTDLSSMENLYKSSSDSITTSPFSPSLQKPLGLNPKPSTQLRPQPHGTIHMLPLSHGISQPHSLPLSFTTSRKTCEQLAPEYTSLLEELAFNILSDYPTGIQSEPGFPLSSPGTTFTLSETVSLNNSFYASLYLKISDDIVGEEWNKVIRLLTRTAEGVEEERRDIGLQRGAGMMSVSTKIGEVEVDATWVFYQLIDGSARECGESEKLVGFGDVGKDAVGSRNEDL